MLIKLGHQFETVFSNHPCGLVTILVILESVIDGQTCHADVDTWLALIARGIESQDRRMLGDSIIEQNDVDIVMKGGPGHSQRKRGRKRQSSILTKEAKPAVDGPKPLRLDVPTCLNPG